MSWISQVAEGLFEILCAIIHIVIIQFKLADEVDFLFHEFCLYLVSLNQGLFLMMTEQISRRINWNFIVENGLLDVVQLFERLKHLFLCVLHFADEVVTDE